MEEYQVQAEKLIRSYASTSSQRERGKGKSERWRKVGRGREEGREHTQAWSTTCKSAKHEMNVCSKKQTECSRQKE